jgi:hypothetical protein
VAAGPRVAGPVLPDPAGPVSPAPKHEGVSELHSLAETLVRSGVRGSRRGRPWKDRTHCEHGHEYTPENTAYRPHGARRCRTCVRERGRRWYATRGAAARAA